MMNSGGSPAEGLKGRNNRIGENYQTFRCTGRDLGSKKKCSRRNGKSKASDISKVGYHFLGKGEHCFHRITG